MLRLAMAGSRSSPEYLLKPPASSRCQCLTNALLRPGTGVPRAAQRGKRFYPTKWSESVILRHLATPSRIQPVLSMKYIPQKLSYNATNEAKTQSIEIINLYRHFDGISMLSKIPFLLQSKIANIIS